MAKKAVKYYVVDAFTDSAFKGNPAAVCLLEEDRDEQWLQSVAAEFNLSETAYLTRTNGSDSQTPRFRLRWFTPVTEVRLCGHATLASAYTLFTTGLVNSAIIEFETLAGILTAKKAPDFNSPIDASEDPQNCFSVELDFPVVPCTELDPTEVSISVSAISKALNGADIIDIKRAKPDDYFLVVLPSAKSVMELKPEIDDIRKYGAEGVIVSGAAPMESGFDFASRCFFPRNGIDEDPVTGSAHCTLAPYWSKKLGKCELMAYQASARGGILSVYLDEKNQRVLLRGKAVIAMEGTLLV
ncbi:putative phenazine biosynthesis protein [Hibiscus syriacus]|uniref:Phenazine biosynthesis protein n=1 Tax=Hibiscus syriacus TaxID=106335 RepID=A0A6A3AYX0_HIBSY|nr:uncharacterized isomerase BH0283-like [Hibiscus syriacus]KAE8708152.1 putative phenazine biosynthesis protein [Hibiscus syriacus]